MSRGDSIANYKIHRLTWLATTLLVVALGGCGGGTAAAPPPAVPRAVSAQLKVSRIVVVVMENREYNDIIGRAGAPYINMLARQSAVAANYYSIAHPSLPNYLALTGGSTFGYVGSDCMTCSVSHRNLIDELEAAGISWKAYMEGIPSTCSFKRSSGGYIRRHDPFMYYRNVADNRSRCRFVVPASRLYRDLAHHSLPRYVWLSPSVCHDMHSCGTNAGDRFLRFMIPRLLRELGPSGILFLTWDEGTTNSGCCGLAKGGHILTLIAGPGAREGTRSAVPYDHYSLLRTIEDLWGLPRLGYAASPSTQPMTDLLRGP
jgi:hypothetical protein